MGRFLQKFWRGRSWVVAILGVCLALFQNMSTADLQIAGEDDDEVIAADLTDWQNPPLRVPASEATVPLRCSTADGQGAFHLLLPALLPQSQKQFCTLQVPGEKSSLDF